MTGYCWRLLAAFLLILVAASLRGQDNGVDRIPLLTRELDLSRDVPIGSPARIPLSPLPPGYPVGGSRFPRGPGIRGPIAFPQIAQAAGIIFSGSVAAVARSTSSKGPISTAITFKVEQAIRGASAGQNLTIHEWAGLWSCGERYRVGERVLLFLYPPSRLGLTSPVAGEIGRFAMRRNGEIPLTPQHVHILAADPVLGGKVSARYDDFAMAVRLYSEE